MPQPIAIVSRSCIFPESLSPQALWKNLLEGRDLLSRPDADRWRTQPSAAMGQRDWNHPGGYVRGFDEIFDPEDFQLDPSIVESLDPLFQWVLHTAKEAYSPIERAEDGDLSVLLGNLSLPSEGLARWAESVWKDEKSPFPLNRYMSGLPAHLVGPALGRRADAFSLDAACASSLYAISLGCEKLRENRADIVLAGAVNRADPLFLNIGFQALQALSPSGQSRPFHRGADGLIPTEGAAFVGLKRLDDAIDCGDDILGIVHDTGLSNDGRSDGLLAPASTGQIRAIEQAYQYSDITPDDVSYVECHATGTPVGDGREIESLSAVFPGDSNIPIGSHKSNMGHAITAAGMAGLLKILGAMEHETLPPTIHCDEPSEALDVLNDSPFRLLTCAEPWNQERKVAAISAFGFGGNNSHLVVENWRGQKSSNGSSVFPVKSSRPEATSTGDEPSVAVVGLGILSGFAKDLAEFEQWLVDPDTATADLRLRDIEIDLDSLQFPPSDLEESLPQQVAMLKAATDAVADVQQLDTEQTGVFTGMQTDPDIVRHGLRARLHADPATQNAVADPLTAAAVVGSLPNIVANRINSHFDLTGYSFALSAEEHSGDVALREACQAIRRGKLESAIVGAVEMATDEAHAEADAATDDSDQPLCDAAIAFVVKRLDCARRDGDKVLATIDDPASIDDLYDTVAIDTPRAHSATGLLRIASCIAVPEFALARSGPSTGIRPTSKLENDALKALPRTTSLHRTPRPVLTDSPKIHRVETGCGATIVACSKAELDDKTQRLDAHLNGDGPLADGVYLHSEAMGGEIAQVFTGAAAAYHNMGRPLCLGFPELVENFQSRFRQLDVATGWMFHPDDSASPTALDKLFASSVLSQLHSEFCARVLGLDFDCAIGFSSGETNALFATGIWRDFDGLLTDFSNSGAFDHQLGGDLQLLNSEWADELGDGEPATWETWRVTGPEAEVQAAIDDEPLARLLIKNAPDDVTIGGHIPALSRIFQRLDDHGRIHLDYDIAVHCQELKAFEETWRSLHSRKTGDTDVRLYSQAHAASYEPTRQNVADALLDQATQTIDFPAVVRQAWDDGVRTFVEHGPRQTLALWIDEILADRPHRVVSLNTGDTDSLRPLARAAAKLDAAGLDVDIHGFNEHIDAHRRQGRNEPKRSIRIAAHRPSVRLPQATAKAQTSQDATVLPKPPGLPPVTDPAIHRPSVQSMQSTTQRPAAPSKASKMSRDKTQAPDHQALPGHFQHLQDAYHSYLEVISTQSAVHEEFIEQSRRGWEMVGGSPIRDMSSKARKPDKPPAPPQNRNTSSKPQHSTVQQPLFDRRDLITHASGEIAEIFGPLFERQKDYPRQVRMPEPPLLLADRVMDIDAEKGVIGTGTVWTETDITTDSWYLFRGHIPPGIMIEAGQADLLLISWMGADFENEGRRAYRLLGCELTYQKGLPKAGDTLEYDIHIDGHAEQGDVRIFFFHYDCRVGDNIRLSVREGQAGFFSDEELAESMGILWTPESAEIRDDATVDPPRVATEQIPEQLTADEVQAFADGDRSACFGAGYQRLRCHNRTPNIEGGDMCLIGAVDRLDVNGGPWKRGYMRTVYDITGDDWFFDGHFKGDPCMPGTLMFETTLEAMAFYMISLGFSLDRDAWRFEPVPDVPFDLKCRGQATPDNEQVVYEIFVEEVIDGDRPRLIADVLATVDGLKAFHGRRIQLHLVPDTPMGEELICEPVAERGKRAHREDDVVHDKLAIRATSRGPATMCLGKRYARFDGPDRMPRLPGEPFQFMTRITDADHQPGDASPGDSATIEWDTRRSDWFFDAAGGSLMPNAVLLEAALQPCGWLSLRTGAVLSSDKPLYYRNLDGNATLHRPIGPDFGRLTTKTTLTRDSTSGQMTIQSFDVECFNEEGELVYDAATTFGFFPKQALENQSGLPTSDEEIDWFHADSEITVDLNTSPVADSKKLWPDDKLRMIDRLTGRWTDGDRIRLRTEKDVDPAEWFFKCHFYQDPVMPGSLGIESMLQTLRLALIDKRLHQRFDTPVVEPVAIGHEAQWSYRGQVLPENKRVTVLLEVTDIIESDGESTIVADAGLWVDAMKIYEANELAMRVRDRRR